MGFVVEPIGVVHCSRIAPEDDRWDSETCLIRLDPSRLSPDAALGLDGFSHVEVIYLFDRVDEAKICRGARHPRGRKDWPLTGILAQRAKDRPNRLGVTVCRLLSVSGFDLSVAGLDAIDGTPVLDVKPYLAEFGPRGELRQPAWSTELMQDYWESKSKP
ncbi:MAG TPA: SAM-dependent methyltransferase [Pseudomonadota bacterium]|jgi:tRNA-Thr(GGU) m(6)t(6)A37 methyltransferase TsaA|nr:SAM-dependent methyltransferase [Pseudomonadota bacterium]